MGSESGACRGDGYGNLSAHKQLLRMTTTNRSSIWAAGSAPCLGLGFLSGTESQSSIAFGHEMPSFPSIIFYSGEPVHYKAIGTCYIDIPVGFFPEHALGKSHCKRHRVNGVKSSSTHPGRLGRSRAYVIDLSHLAFCRTGTASSIGFYFYNFAAYLEICHIEPHSQQI